MLFRCHLLQDARARSHTSRQHLGAMVNPYDQTDYRQTNDAGEKGILRWNEGARRRSPSPESSTCFCFIGGKSKELHPTVIAGTGLGLDIISIGFRRAY